ncbi:hypothetical protein KKA03_06430, partial [archaeon]|nr:hypothetical protein [archaeon]
PHVQVYNSGTDIIILGSDEPMDISYPRLAEKLKDPRIKSDFNEMSQVPRFTTYPDVDWFLSTYKMDSLDVAEYVEGDIQMNTDDHTVLEFRTAINAMRKRYAPEDQQSTVDPLSDMISFMESWQGSPFFVPPLTGMVEQKESKDFIGLLDIEVERESSWILDTASCKYIHGVVSSEVLAYSSNCYAKYLLPDQGILIATFVDTYSPPEKEEFERLIRDNFGFDSVNYGWDVVVNEHDAYIFDVSLGGGNAEGLSIAWHCGDKNRVYMVAAVYPKETYDKAAALDAVSKVRCYPS